MTDPESIGLTDGWTLSFTHPATGERHRMPATVPGNVEIDLQRHGLIDDPCPPDDVGAMRRWELVDDWTYETRFDAPEPAPGERVNLVFEGVDTIADVALNGEHVLRCENMLIPHAVDVTGRLRPGRNELSVRIRSAELHARGFACDAFQVSRDRQAQAYLRKARHMWGWDNAPRLVSAGIWRPVRLEILPPVRFSEIYAYTQKVTADTVHIGLNWAFETPEADLTPYCGRVTLASDGKVEHSFDFNVDFVAGRLLQELPRDAVRLWWPRGYGDPHLYELTVTLYKHDETVAEHRARFGIRELELRYTETTTPEGDGEFVFVCNGEKIYVNGTNWKPLDPLHSRAEARVRKALELCLDLNCNMVRIWGGGVYEDHPFFDFCDENGLLVWQDFMFACEFPPRDPFFLDAVRREADTIVKRLRNHPSLAVWCGDNEVDDMFFWNTTVPKNILPSDNAVTRRVLRDAVLSHDPYRSYVPSSPYISDILARERWHPPETRSGRCSPEKHLYPGNEKFREAFRDTPAHFVGETGPFFINAMSQTPWIVERELPRARRLWETPIDGRDYTLDRHQRDVYFLTWKDASRHRLRHLFGRDFPLEPWEDLALGVNIICAEIFKFAVEYYRSMKWRKTGVLWWSLLDMWPMMFNYSVVDVDFNPKQPCYDWIRLSQQPRCLMVVEQQAGRPVLYAANDTRQPWHGRCRVVALDERGAETPIHAADFQSEPNRSTKLADLALPDAPRLWLIDWESDAGDSFNHFVAGRPPFSFQTCRDWCCRIEDRIRGSQPNRT
jgi:beta-mannosidase